MMEMKESNALEIGTCTTGAIILGVGVGARFFSYLGNYYYLLILIGIVIHGLGMYQLHRRARFPNKEWHSFANILYWACWIIVIASILYIIFQTFIK